MIAHDASDPVDGNSACPAHPKTLLRRGRLPGSGRVKAPCRRAQAIASVSASWTVSKFDELARDTQLPLRSSEAVQAIRPSLTRLKETRSVSTGARSPGLSFLMNIRTPKSRSCERHRETRGSRPLDGYRATSGCILV